MKKTYIKKIGAGSVIDNKYELLWLIGRGGGSEVYLAVDRRINRQWAVKAFDKSNKIM